MSKRTEYWCNLRGHRIAARRQPALRDIYALDGKLIGCIRTDGSFIGFNHPLDNDGERLSRMIMGRIINRVEDATHTWQRRQWVELAREYRRGNA